MAWALVVDGAIVAVRNPKGAERRLSDGAWVCPVGGEWPDDLAASCGFARIVDTAQPAGTPTTTHDRTVALVAGTPTVTWTERPKTAAELQADTVTTTAGTMRTRLLDALATNRTFLGVASPTSAQTLAQVRSLTRQMSALTRVLVHTDTLTDPTVD